MTRYARQVILPEIGEAGQARLGATHIVIVGAGGLAAAALPLLAGAGVGHLTIIDGDRVEIGNLHRQTFFTEGDIGLSKAEAASVRCKWLNSEIVVDAVPARLNPVNVDDYTTADLVLDCADSYAVSYILSDHCHRTEIPLISASALGVTGYVGGFCGTAPSLRAVFPQAPESGESCDSLGVMGPVVSALGAMQAQLALNHLLAIEPPALGRFIRYHGLTCRTSSFCFRDAAEPDTYFRFTSPALLQDSDLIIDLRGHDEAAGLIDPRARRIPVAECTDLPDRTAHDATNRLALCCATGLRAWRTAERLETRWPGEIVLVAASAS